MTQAEETEPRSDPAARVPEVVPVLPSGGTVVYPFQLVPILAAQERDIRAVDEAASSPAKMVGIFAQKPTEDGHYHGDLYEVGTAAIVARMVKAPDGSINAILQGVARIRLLSIEQAEPWTRARVERLPETVERDLELEALARSAVSLFQRIAELSEMPAEYRHGCFTAPGHRKL